MSRFVEHAGGKYRVLKQDESGCWLISYDDPRAPFLADTATMEGYLRIETPKDFLAYWNKSEFSDVEKERLSLIQPLLGDEKCISDKEHRLVVAKECAVSGDSTVRRVLRVYYRRLAMGILVESKDRSARTEPNFDWAIRTFYFSSKRFSLRAAYEMMLVQRYTSEEGVFVDDLPSWSIPDWAIGELLAVRYSSVPLQTKSSNRWDILTSQPTTSLFVKRTYAIEPPCTGRYARWCERSASELIACLLLDLID